VLDSAGSLDAEPATCAVRNIADAVAELHERGIIHRDIKPSNVLLDMSGRVYVTDFGIACQRMRGSDRVAGTPGYMAPEMLRGEVSPRTDVFALGATLHELLTGELPAGQTVEELRKLHGAQTPSNRLAQLNLDARLIEAIERATHRDPLFRHKTARHFSRALSELGPSDTAQRTLTRLVAQTMHRGDETPAKPPGEPGSSYQDKLHELAERKRASVETPDVQPEQPVAVAEPLPLHVHCTPAALQESSQILTGDEGHLSGRLTQTVSCVRCGYDLRWQRAAGNCSECGAPVTDSISPERLVFADALWLGRVGRGLRLLQITFNAWTLCVLLGVLVLPAMAFWPRASTSRTTTAPATAAGSAGMTGVVIVLGIALLGLQILAIAGAMLATARDPAAGPRDHGQTLRRWTRWSLWLNVIMIAPAILAEWIAPGVAWVQRLANGLWALLLVGMIALLLGCLTTLCKRLPERRLHRWLRSDMIAVTLCALPIIAILVGWSGGASPSPLHARTSLAAGIVFVLLLLGQLMLGILLTFGPALLASRMGKLRRAIVKAARAHVDRDKLISVTATSQSG
ncbi:MAG: protein kinase domain-containing protein, partial [Tepidisphaeraceae bacterium]